MDILGILRFSNVATSIADAVPESSDHESPYDEFGRRSTSCNGLTVDDKVVSLGGILDAYHSRTVYFVQQSTNLSIEYKMRSKFLHQRISIEHFAS